MRSEHVCIATPHGDCWQCPTAPERVDCPDAAVFAILQYSLITEMPQIYMIIFGAIMILAILFMPTGIVGVYERVINRIKKGKSKKGEGTDDANA